MTDPRRAGRTIALALAALLAAAGVEAQAERADSASAGDEKRGVAFFVAIESGDVAKIKELLASGPPDNVSQGRTPLIKAAWDGEAEIIDLLLAAGAKVKFATADGETALVAAIRRDRVDIAKQLIKAGADVNTVDSYKQTPLSNAAAAGNVELAALLIASGARIDDDPVGLTPLMFSAATGNAEMLRLLVKKGAKVNYGLGAKEGSGQTALMTAIYSGKADSVKTLIELGADVKRVTRFGETPLALARKGEQEEIVALLVAAGAKK